MKSYYLDTNVLLSQYKPTDPYHDESLAIVKALRERRMVGYTGSITILEACSFASRNYVPRRGETQSEAKRLAVAKMLETFSKLRLAFSTPPGEYPILIGNREILMPSIFHDALVMTLSGLRTLDILHLAAAKYAGETEPEIRGFVTGDSELLEARKTIARIVNMPFLSPKELLRVPV